MGMDDQEIFGLIECFRERLKKLIIVKPLMDLLHFIEDDEKELVRVKLNTQGNPYAVDLLLDIITKGVRPQGWFREFIDALETVGCMHAVSYINNNPPSPSSETDNDSCVKLIQLLLPSLVKMKTRDVCVSCYSLDILTEEDRDNVLAEIENHGNAGGARLLLRRVVRHEIGWFSTFLRALQKTGHPDLVKELLGEDMVDDEGYKLYGQGDAPDATKGLELKAGDVQSEGSQSATGFALEGSTQSVTGLLYDYMDGDTEIDLYTDPFEQDIGQVNKDSQTSGVPVKAPAEAPGAALECPRVGGRTRAVPPVDSHAQPHGTHSGGNPRSTLRGQRPSSVRHYHHHHYHHHHALTASETLLRAPFSGQRCNDADDDNQETDSEAGTDSRSDTDTEGDRGADVDADADADEWNSDDQCEDGSSVSGSDQDSHGYRSYDDDNDYSDYDDDD